MDWNARSGYHGFSLGNAGVAAGVTRKIGARSHLGAAFGYDYARLEMNGIRQRDDMNAVQFALYGGYNTKRQFIDYQLGYGKTFHDPRRRVDAFAETLTAGYDDNILSLSARYGHRYGPFLPSVGAELIQVWTPGFTESGGAAALSATKSDYTSLELPIGFRLTKTFTSRELRSRNIALTPELRTFWVPQVGDTSSQVITSFTSGGPSFLATSGDFGWQHTQLGTGFTARLNRHWSTSANYDAAFYTGNQTLQGASVGVTARF